MKRTVSFGVVGVLVIGAVCAQGGPPLATFRPASVTPVSGMAVGPSFGAAAVLPANMMGSDGECPSCATGADHLWDSYCFDKEHAIGCCTVHVGCDACAAGQCDQHRGCDHHGCLSCRLRSIFSCNLLTSIFGAPACAHCPAPVVDAPQHAVAAPHIHQMPHAPPAGGRPAGADPRTTRPPVPVDSQDKAEPNVPRNQVPAKATRRTPRTSQRTVSARLVSQRLSDYIKTD